MLDKTTEQFQNFFKPFQEIASVNVKVIEELAIKQNALFSNLLNDGVALVEGIQEKNDINSVMASQKTYAEGMQEKVTTASKEMYDVVSTAQQKSGEVLKAAFDEAQQTFSSAVTPS